jgi:dihydrofolate reductase/thymidylate synthase
MANCEERQYLDLVREILEKGNRRGDRTGTGTLSVFGRSMRFDLRGGRIPLLTTKRVYWKGVVEELLWFISGSTDARVLARSGVHIWDGNTSREFLDSRGLTHYKEGDIGAGYGYQWRHFGAEYKGMDADYTGQGVDQLADLIKTIKANPTDRRMILSAWNPADLGKMVLPPCHMFAQFYVNDGELSCLMHQRSCDMGLGVPFNIASYALLTHMIAQVCGLRAGEFIHSMGDCHVYLNHIDALKQQLEREPRDFPTLKINPEVTDIDAFKADDFTLSDYNPHPTIAMPMAV